MISNSGQDKRMRWDKFWPFSAEKFSPLPLEYCARSCRVGRSYLQLTEFVGDLLATFGDVRDSEGQ